MITKRITYTVKINPDISLFAETITSLLNKIERDIQFWEECLRDTKDKKFCKKIKKLIKEYKKAFKEVINYKE